MRLNVNQYLSAIGEEFTTVLSTPYNAWLARTQGEIVYPDWVAERIAALMTEIPEPREKSFRGSEAGQCKRRQELKYIGMAEISRILETEYERADDVGLLNIFNDGRWRHLRWQANLLTAGLITDIEYALPWPARRSRGTVDAVGMVPDSHPNPAWRGLFFGVELKGMNSWPYKKYTEANDQMEKHRGQFSRYFLSGGFDLFVVLYECKDSNEFHEWVFEPDPKLLAEAQTELDEINQAVDRRTLHQPLLSCKARMGKAWKDCPFAGKGGICERMDRWP